MDVIFTHCAGLDVQKKTVMARRVTPDPSGQHADGLMEVREFGTLTRDLLALSDWLDEIGITHVAMESTGEYWKPVYNIMLSRNEPYQELGANYFDERRRDHLVDRLTQRIERLGYCVTLEAVAAV